MSKPAEESILKTELTEDEAKLLADISDHISSLSSDDTAAVEASLKELSTLLETPTDTAVVAIPKALKFIRRFYPVMKDRFSRLPSDSPLRPLLADILALITITIPREDGAYDSLKYKLQGTPSNLWGHEFLRAVEGDIAVAVPRLKAAITTATDARPPTADADADAQEAYGKVVAAGEQARRELDEIHRLVGVIVPMELRRNAEPYACDLLLECERLRDIVGHTTEHNWRRVAFYLTSLALYQPAPDDREVLAVAQSVYMTAASYSPAAAREALPLALRVAMRLGGRAGFDEVLAHPAATGPLRRQLAAMLARGRHFVVNDSDEDAFELGSNKLLSASFVHAARALDHAAPKSPDDVLKATAPRSGHSAQLNLARCYANGFANAAHVTDRKSVV